MSKQSDLIVETETWIASLPWDPEMPNDPAVSDEIRTLVVGNIRGFASHLATLGWQPPARVAQLEAALRELRDATSAYLLCTIGTETGFRSRLDPAMVKTHALSSNHSSWLTEHDAEKDQQIADLREECWEQHIRAAGSDHLCDGDCTTANFLIGRSAQVRREGMPSEREWAEAFRKQYRGKVMVAPSTAEALGRAIDAAETMQENIVDLWEHESMRLQIGALRKAQARIAQLEAALREMSDIPCAKTHSLTYGCLRGGALRKNWCAACIARAALSSDLSTWLAEHDAAIAEKAVRPYGALVEHIRNHSHSEEPLAGIGCELCDLIAALNSSEPPIGCNPQLTPNGGADTSEET